MSSYFSHIEDGARLVLVGQTPGRSQHKAAVRAYDTALAKGHTPRAALRLAKYAASFSGGMRQNLVSMLDHVGVADAFGIESCHALFDHALEGYAHHTSALQNPVFVDGRNYNGNPDMIRTPELRMMIETLLAKEARFLPNALWLPLGPKPLAALHHLVTLGILGREQILPAIPHPSGANAERIAYFLGRKARQALSIKTRPDPIDETREHLRARISAVQTAWRARA